MADTLEALELKITHNSGGAAGALKEVTSALTSLLPVITDVNTKVHSLAIGLQNIGGIKALGTAIKAVGSGTKSTAMGLNGIADSLASINKDGKNFKLGDKVYTLGKQLKGTTAQLEIYNKEMDKFAGKESLTDAQSKRYVSLYNRIANAESRANKLQSEYDKTNKSTSEIKIPPVQYWRDKTGSGLEGGSFAAWARQTENDATGRVSQSYEKTAEAATKAATAVRKVAAETITVSNAAEKFGLGDKLAATNDQINATIRRLIELNAQLNGADKASERTKILGQIANAESRYNSLIDKQKKLVAAEGGEEKPGRLTSAFEKLHKGFERTNGMVQRIMMRRIITSAIRAAAKAFKEGYTNLYNWSEAVGGQFSKDMDKAAAAMTQFKNSLAGAVAPALQALVPVIQTVCSWIATLMSYISMFVAAISGMTKYYTALTGDTKNYAKAAGGAAKANKDLLASFDELNVIQSESGGGGGGGGAGGANNPFAVGELDDKIRNRLARIGKIVGAATMAIGGILLFTGHPFVGLAMLSAGFGTLYGSIRVDWKTTENKIASVIDTIDTIIGGAFLAVGGILAFTGANVPLGLGLLAVGALKMGGKLAENFELPEKILKWIDRIQEAVSLASLATGIILTFSGHIGLGVGLIASGAVGLGKQLSDEWSGYDTLVKKIAAIVEIVGKASAAVGVMLMLTGNIPVGLGLVLGGLAAIFGSQVAAKVNWNYMGEKIKSIFSEIGAFLKNNMLTIGVILTLFGNPLVGIPLIAGGIHFKAQDAGIKGGFLEEIKWAIEQVKSWFDTNIASPVKEFFNSASKWWQTHIAEPAGKAFAAVSQWWDTNISKPVGKVIDTVKGYIDKFKPAIDEKLAPVVESIGNWWKKYISGPIGAFIDTVKGYINKFKPAVDEKLAPVIEAIGAWWNTYVVTPIKGFFSSVSAWWGEHITEPAKKAFAAVSDWWTTNISEPISRSFESIKTWWSANVAEPIRDSIAAISVWWEANISKPVSQAIETIGTWWTKYVSGPVGKFIGTIKGYIDRFKPAFDEKLAPVIESIGKWWNTYVAGPINAVFNTISSIISTLKSWLGIKETKHIDVEFAEKSWTGGSGSNSGGSGSTSTTVPGLNGDITLAPRPDLTSNNYLKENKLLKVSTRAEGGFIRTGQLFIAGENGIPEMIGSFGRNNAVANNEMIVTGIRQGVRDAMNEQNVLLRQQNEYLSALLNKRIYAELKPSAALGATNARSAELYAKVTGG